MIKILYTFLAYIAQPFIFLRIFLRSYKIKTGKKRIGERYGFYGKLTPNKKTKNIWLHAVSVGETIAAVALIKRLIDRYPNNQIVVTTMTVTGSMQVKKIFGSAVDHVYVPYDLPFCINRFLNHFNPIIAIFMETELWPNIIDICKRRDISVIIANARLSERSTKGYARISKLTKSMLKNISIVAAQHQSDGERFISLGLENSKLFITGSLKYDLEFPQNLKNDGETLKKTWLINKPLSTKVMIAVSTHKDEEKIILTSFKELSIINPELLLIIVPRHPERFNDVYQLCLNEQFVTVRRSKNETVQMSTKVVLADTMGEVLLLLSASDIAFMGGSLVPVGGHNFMEPAALGLPQITGPHVFNFQHVVDKLIASKAILQIQSASELKDAFLYLLNNDEVCKAMGSAARMSIEKEQGSLHRHLKLIETLLKK